MPVYSLSLDDDETNDEYHAQETEAKNVDDDEANLAGYVEEIGEPSDNASLGRLGAVVWHRTRQPDERRDVQV